MTKISIAEVKIVDGISEYISQDGSAQVLYWTIVLDWHALEQIMSS